MPRNVEVKARIDSVEALLPRALAEQQMNLKRWTVMERGGHFAAAEQPAAVAAELRQFFLHDLVEP